MKLAAAVTALLATLGAAVALGDGDRTETARTVHGIEIFADWQALPDVAARATKAAGEDVEVDVHAWGDTARGCYITVQSVATNGGKPHTELHEALRRELEIGAQISSWVSDDATESNLEFDTDALHGTVRTVAGATGGLLRTATAACFYNPQSSDWCAPRCSELLNQLEVAP